MKHDTTIYGIKNCDTMKKALRWLEAHDVRFVFHDYKKDGVDDDVLRIALDQHGWENVINRKGTTWRQLSDSVKKNMNEERAIKTASKNASIIKRPILLYKKEIFIGFKDDLYANIFSN